MKNITVSDIMCDHPIYVKENVNVGSVAHLLFRYRINGMLVVKEKNEKHLVGIFTTTDLLRLIERALLKGRPNISQLRRISSMLVGKVATKNIISLSHDAKVSKAIMLMHKKKIHTIPIFNEDNLVGVVGRHDLLNISLNFY